MRKLILAGILLLNLCACTELDYYLHFATGHLQIISKRRPISELLKPKNAPQQLQTQLAQIAQIRDFASQSLQLPENDSYRSYVKLDRPYVVWTVVATPELSLEPLQWCFPVVGCVSYRGYFEQDKAKQFARSLDQTANDTIITGVPAYSTLNWFDDPVLSTFSDWPTVSIAKLIFHELAHQKLYIPDDTVFNESFATAVEQVGIERWLNEINDPAQEQSYYRQQSRQNQFHELLLLTRNKLEQLYNSPLPDERKRRQKQNIFADMRKSYQQLRKDWQDYPGYDSWFSQLNNARFASIDNYHRWVPALLLVLEQEEKDLTRFYWRCQTIANLPLQQRHQLLDRLTAHYRATAGKSDNP